MIAWSTAVFSNTLQEYVFFLLVLILGALGGKLTSWITQHIIKKFAAKTKTKTKTKIDDVLVDVCDGPLVLGVFIATFAFSQTLLAFSPEMEKVYMTIIRVLATVNIAWLLVRFLDSVIENYIIPYVETSESDLHDVILPILQTLVKIIVVSMAAIMVLSDFGFNVAGLVAGLGIGGLAFAFAAKDLIGNIFGGVSVIADKPFKIGDMIKFDNRQGTVKEIGIRTTRIETLDGTLLIIPNAKFTDGIIENVTRRKQHRVALNLGLVYDTPTKKLKKAGDIVRVIIKKHPGTKDDCIVFFNTFGQSSLDIALYYFITDIKNMPQIQHEINSAIKEQFEKAKIEFAYPTQTMIMKKER